jgi:hypothetical protein
MSANKKKPFKRKILSYLKSPAIIAELIGGLLVISGTIAVIKNNNVKSKSDELQTVLDSVAQLYSTVSKEYQVYMELSEKLAGKAVYGNEHREALVAMNKYPDHFTEDIQKEIESIASKIERRYSKRKSNTVLGLLKTTMEISNLFMEVFYEDNGTIIWKTEPIKHPMLIMIYNNQIDTVMKNLPQEVRLLYEKN